MQCLEEFLPKFRLERTPIIDGAVANGCMSSPVIRPGITVEGAVKQAKAIRNVMHFIQMLQVTANPLAHRFGDQFGVRCVDIRANSRKALQEISAINQNCGTDHVETSLSQKK